MELTQEQYKIVKRIIGTKAAKKGICNTHFAGLTGAMLRDLIVKCGIKLSELPEDSGLFQNVDDEAAMKFLETHPRFSVGGWFTDKASYPEETNGKFNGNFHFAPALCIDTIWGAENVRRNSRNSTYNFLTPKLTKKEARDFSNLFHHADEFVLDENYAYAWFD